MVPLAGMAEPYPTLFLLCYLSEHQGVLRIMLLILWRIMADEINLIGFGSESD